MTNRTFSSNTNINDVIGYLSKAIDELQGFNGESKVNLSSNTYGMSMPCQIRNLGFIDLDPINIEHYIEK